MSDDVNVESRALQDLVRSVPLFELVGPGHLVEIVRLLRPEVLKAGQVVFRQGQPGQSMWVLGPGVEVSLSAWSEVAARPVAVAKAQGGETIGEMALVDEGPRSATATVVKGGPTQRIDLADFRALRDAHHPAAFRVMRKICIDLCAKLRATSDRIAPVGERPILAPKLRPVPLPSPEILDAYPPFRVLPQVVKLALAQKLTQVETAGPELVFGEGERGDAAYFVIGGEVRVERSGKRMAVLGPGAMFGMVALIDSGGRAATCGTAGPARLLRLGASEFEALFAAGNRFSHEVVKLVARQLVEHLRIANSLLPQPEAAALPASDEAHESSEEPSQLPLDQELELILNSD